MKATRVIMAALLCAAVLAPQVANAGRNPGPVKFTMMTRVESHSETLNADGNFGNEVFAYESLSVYRELQQNTFGNLFFLTKYSFDEGEIVSNIGGAGVIHVFGPHAVAALSYSHTSNEERGVVLLNEEDRDRLALSVIWNINPYNERTKFRLITGLSTATDWCDQRTLSEKLEVAFPKLGSKLSGLLGYTFTYSLNNSEQLTNQFQGRLSYRLSKTNRIDLGALFIDNTYEGNPGDDSVFRLSWYRYVK